MTTEPCAARGPGKQTVRASARASAHGRTCRIHPLPNSRWPRNRHGAARCGTGTSLIAEHSLWHAVAKAGGYVPTEEERKAYPPTRHPLVRRHPGSERNALYIAATASHIVGLPVADGQALLAELINFATQTQFVYRHRR